MRLSFAGKRQNDSTILPQDRNFTTINVEMEFEYRFKRHKKEGADSNFAAPLFLGLTISR